MHIQDISQQSRPVLAKILQFRPIESREVLAHRIKAGAKSLPSSLRPNRLEKLLLPARGNLCDLHQCLDHEVVGTIILHIQLEVGVRLNNLITKHELLSPEQNTRVTRLRELHVLWLDSREYRKTFQQSAQDVKWTHQADKCPGCIVSRISSDLETLLDIRWAFRSRATRAFVIKYGNPRLQIWCHVWIATLIEQIEQATGTPMDLDAIMLQNDEEAIMLKKVRVAIAVEKHQESLRKNGPPPGMYVTEVPIDYSYPIGVSPFEPKPQEPPATQTAQNEPEFQAEEYIGDTNEAQLERMDSYEALTSTPYLPGTLNTAISNVPAESSMTVCADESSRGQSPYQHKSRFTPTLESMHSVDVNIDKGLHIVTEEADAKAAHEAEAINEYIPPRSLWKTSKPAEPALASSSLLPWNDSVQSVRRPASRLSQESWERSSISSKSSWETERCVAVDTTSSVYSSAEKPPPRPAYASPSDSWLSLSKVAGQTYHTQAKQRASVQKQRPAQAIRKKSNPAQTYENLIQHDTPFSESEATLRASNMEQERATQIPEQVRTPRKQYASGEFSASSLYMRLMKDCSQPVDSSTNHYNSIATPLRQVEFGEDVHHRALDPTGPSEKHGSTSTEHFLKVYDEVVSSYMPTAAQEPDSTTSISTASRNRLTPEPLFGKKISQVKTEHEKEVDRIVAEITRGTIIGDPEPPVNFSRKESRVQRRSSHVTRSSSTRTPSLCSNSTLTSRSSAKTITPERLQRSQAVAQTRGHERSYDRARDDSPDAGSDLSDETTWSVNYRDQLASRESLQWYHGQEKKEKHKRVGK